MARVLFATVPIAGHVLPFVGVCRALVARGHQVRWYTGERYRETVERAGARHEPFRNARDFDDEHMEQAFPERAALSGLRQLEHDVIHVFGAQAAGQLRDLEQLVRGFAPELVLGDPLMAGALLLKERYGIPLVLINVVANTISSRDTAPFGLAVLPTTRWYGPLRNRALELVLRKLLLRRIQTHWADVRRSLGFGRPVFFTDAPLVADLFLQPTVPEFEYPRSDLPGNVRFVGALASDPPERPPDEELLTWLQPGRPLIHVTQGTMSNARPDLIAPALRGLAREPVQVVVATGGRTAAELGLVDLPENARIESFVSYPALLPRTAVMITNGGYGGVHLALSHGVPLVVWGTTEDKPETAARVAWSGVGIRLTGEKPSPRAVRGAVRAVLRDPRYGRRARELASALAKFDAVERVVTLAEGLLTRRA